MNYTQEIINKSNAWYNDGLRKAKVRNLTGAIVSLRRSLQFNRENIDARNLLGLVFYGRGEVAEALVEWIISTNFKNQNNPANHFLRQVQRNPGELEVINQAIKAYNHSIEICQQGGYDMAIIQLKRAVADHPRFLRAWQLLALLYMHSGQYAKARQALVTARRIDTADEITLLYIHEMSRISNEGSNKKKRKTNTIEYSHGNETIIQPKANFASKISSRVMIGNILFGAFIGAALIWYLVMPAVLQTRYDRASQQMIEYSQRIQSLEAQVSAQTRVLDEYRAADAHRQGEAALIAETQASFENLITAQSQLNSGEFGHEQMADTLLSVNRDLLDEEGQEMYDNLADAIFPTAAGLSFTAGVEALYAGNYTTAIERFTRVITLNLDFEGGAALLNLGIAFQNVGDEDSAIRSFELVLERFPYTDNAIEAESLLDAINR